MIDIDPHLQKVPSNVLNFHVIIFVMDIVRLISFSNTFPLFRHWCDVRYIDQQSLLAFLKFQSSSVHLYMHLPWYCIWFNDSLGACCLQACMNFDAFKVVCVQWSAEKHLFLSQVRRYLQYYLHLFHGNCLYRTCSLKPMGLCFQKDIHIPILAVPTQKGAKHIRWKLLAKKVHHANCKARRWSEWRWNWTTANRFLFCFWVGNVEWTGHHPFFLRYHKSSTHSYRFQVHVSEYVF